MAEYDLVCDVCRERLGASEAVLSWREDERAKRERAFALTHQRCAPADANGRREARDLASPNGYLAFVAERFRRVADGWRMDVDTLESVLYALAPFVMRPDSGAEMDTLRAASFGARPGERLGAARAEAGK